jgi:thiol-disulfide isomerase/thioredoxin
MNNIKHYAKEIMSFTLLLFIVSSSVNYYRSLDLNKDKFHLDNVKLLDKSNYSYPDNKALMVHFWATWCPICKLESPNIQTLSNEYSVLTIATDSGDDENIIRYLKDNNLTFDVLNDEDYKLSKKFNINVFPTTLIYDRNHNLIFTEVGYSTTIGLRLRMWWASF